MMGNIHDWQNSTLKTKHYITSNGRVKSLTWPYTGDITNPKYRLDRDTLFAKSGNGWWWYDYDHQNPYRISKKQKRRKK